jgi:hypothetical protein
MLISPLDTFLNEAKCYDFLVTLFHIANVQPIKHAYTEEMEPALYYKCGQQPRFLRLNRQMLQGNLL